MTHRDIVVIGASAGGIPSLMAIVGGLPRDLPAAVFVVVHVPPYAVSHLPEILSRAGPLPARHAVDGEAFVPGRIYVAPPDRHLLIREGAIQLSRGPRENHSRPAVDPLFRTAARVYGPRVIGVVLSGALHDGSLGLLAVKTRGGVALVQDPNEAAVDSMPRRALELVPADRVLTAAEISDALATLTRDTLRDEGEAAMVDDEARVEAVIAGDFASQSDDRRTTEASVFSCPECGGVLWQSDGPVLRFRCHVGHAYSPEVLLNQQSEVLEAALWTSLRLLREKATLSRQLAVRASRSGTSTGRIEEQAELDERHAKAILELLEGMPSPLDQAAVVASLFSGDGDKPNA